MKTTVNQRLEILINSLGITKNAFSKQLGVASTQIYNIINGRNAPSFDLLQKIANTFPSANIMWLLTEKGTPLSTKQSDFQDSSGLIDKVKILEEQIANISAQMDSRSKIDEKEAIRILSKAISKR